MLEKANPPGLAAAAWEPFFRTAEIAVDRLQAAKSEKAKTTIIGTMLSQYVGREVPVAVKGRTGKATLRVETTRARQKTYHFEVVWDVPGDSEGNSESVSNKAAVERTETGVATRHATRDSRSGTKKKIGMERGQTSEQHAPEQRKRIFSAGNNELW
jgi:hypothetical protein